MSQAVSSSVLPFQETLWSVTNTFFQPFTASDWARKHGRDWTFADVPYHLTYFNHLIADAIEQGEHADDRDEITTLAQLNAFNNAQFTRRYPDESGPRALADMERSQGRLRAAFQKAGEAACAHLPILRVRGWRTDAFALEYNAYHTWLHLTEAHLRYTDQLPGIPPDTMRRALNFHMDLTAGAVSTHHAKRPFTWLLELGGDGGGAWMFHVGEGLVRVDREARGNPDLVMRTDIASYLEMSDYNMANPLLLLAQRRVQVKGISKLRRLSQLLAVDVDQVWEPSRLGEAA